MHEQQYALTKDKMIEWSWCNNQAMHYMQCTRPHKTKSVLLSDQFSKKHAQHFTHTAVLMLHAGNKNENSSTACCMQAAWPELEPYKTNHTAAPPVPQ